MSDAHNHADHGNAPHAEGAHEKTDLNYQPMVWIIPASIAFVLLFVAIIVFLSAGTASNEMTAKQYGSADAGKGPLLAQHAHEDSILTFTGTDTAGHQHIPITTAMAVLAARGAHQAPTTTP